MSAAVLFPAQGFAGLHLHVFRFVCLSLAVVIYALSGSPTPDNPGLPEIVIGVFLVLAALPALPSLFGRSGLLWFDAGRLFLFFGLSLPLVWGVVHGNDLRLILRDLIPFLFILLPLFLQGVFRARPEYSKIFTALFVFLGLVFAVRGVFENLAFFAQIFRGDELYYLANAASVLFAALYLWGRGVQGFMHSKSLASSGTLLVFAALAVLPLLAMAVTFQRASLGYFALYLALIFALHVYRYPLRSGALFLIALILFVPLAGIVQDLIHALVYKTSLHGFNARGQEWAAVWQQVSRSPLSLIFGGGWGATFESPAVADIRVNFTHGFFSTALLKTGIAGLCLSALYLLGIVQILAGIIKTKPVLGLALAGPFLIDTLLYASFKSLDFGLLLLLITAAGARIPAACARRPVA